MQRYARWLGRFQTLESAGYWVITWPPEMRAALKTRAGRDAAKKAVVGVFKAAGYDIGCGRWHFVGDRNPTVWHPHLNVVVAGSQLPKERLEALKSVLREVLGLPNEPGRKGVIHYKFRDTPAKLCHLARYVTKPHWGPGGLEWETEVALDMAGWHNDFWWGKWTGRANVWELEGEGPTGAMVALAKGRCPECGGGIQWGPVEALSLDGWIPVAPGYFRRPYGVQPSG